MGMAPGQSRNVRDAFWSRRSWLGWGAIVLVWFVVVYGGCNWLTDLRSQRVRLHWDFELRIPLVPAALVVYQSLSPLMVLSGVVLKNAHQWRALACTMMTAIGLAGIGFLVFPADLGYVPWHEDVPAEWYSPYALTESVVGSHNLFPSLHVALAWICAAAYAQSTPTWLVPLWCGWVGGIAVATLLVHQHHLIDVAGGIALGWFCMTTIYPWCEGNYVDRSIE